MNNGPRPETWQAEPCRAVATLMEIDGLQCNLQTCRSHSHIHLWPSSLHQLKRAPMAMARRTLYVGSTSLAGTGAITYVVGLGRSTQPVRWQPYCSFRRPSRHHNGRIPRPRNGVSFLFHHLGPSEDRSCSIVHHDERAHDACIHTAVKKTCARMYTAARVADVCPVSPDQR